MFIAEPTDAEEQWRAWREALRDERVRGALESIYQQIDQEVVARRPVCESSGRCCRFETYGHRLFVTGLETAWVLARVDQAAKKRLALAELPSMDGCPFQIERLCSVHAMRPLGCRVFFCDPTADAWQNKVYEQFQRLVRAVHQAHELPYRYIEWRAALDEARRYDVE